MHYLTLIAVDIPQIAENEKENEEVKAKIEFMKANKPDGKDYLYDITLEELEETQTTFARLVASAGYEFMEPYGQDSEEYQEFIDLTEDLKVDYENGKGNFIKTPDGRIVDAFRGVDKHNFAIQDGKVYEYVGKIWLKRRLIRTKLAKKMKPLIDYPYAKAYKTFDLFAREARGENYDEEREAYGYYCNPNTCYDWCVIGGRWPNVFLVKDDCREVYLSKEKDCTKKTAPKGYKWVTAARMKDIEWGLMKEYNKQTQTKNYQTCVEYFAKGEVPPDTYYALKENGFRDFGKMVYEKGESLDSFLMRHGVFEETKYPSICYSYIYDGEYHERWEYSNSERVGYDRALLNWQKEVDEYLGCLAPEDVLIAVDIHI